MNRFAPWIVVALLVTAGCSDQALFNPPDPVYPAIEVTPLALEYGSLEVGSGGLTQQVTITSVGQVDLDIRGLTLDAPAHFSVSMEEAPFTLEPGGATIARITFEPLDGSEVDGVFIIDSNDPDQPSIEVPLHGAGLGPALVIEPAVWDFGNPGVFCTETVDLDVVSAGNTPVTIDSWEFESLPSGTAMSWSTQDLYQGLVLDPGDSAVITISVYVEALESYTGLLTVHPVEEIMAATATQTAIGAGGDWVTDHFVQEGNNDTDILWVVDNSCSMSEEQSTLADDFINFHSIVEAEGIDYRIAVVTTDDEDFVGSTKVIDSATPNGDQIFAENCTLGTNGSGVERGLKYGYDAMQKAVLGTAPNNNFYRSTAGLRVVFVSDENDQSGSWLDYVADYQSLKFNPDHVILSAIVGTDGVDADDCNGPGGDAAAGTGYVDAVNATGGILASICAADWSAALTNIGWISLSLADTLALSEEPIPETISVEINGVGLSTGWYHDAVLNAVILEPDYVPVDGDEVDVTYQIPGTCAG